MRHGRFFLALILVLGSLAAVAGSSAAQEAGAELVEAIAADAAGSEAYAVLESVEGFAAEGGDAVFEPGTENEESFTYAVVDLETSRLVGLTRPAPVSHAAGSRVAVISGDGEAGPTPAPSPSPENTPNASPAPSPSPENTLEEASSDGGADGSAADPNDPESSQESDGGSTEETTDSCEIDLLCLPPIPPDLTDCEIDVLCLPEEVPDPRECHIDLLCLPSVPSDSTVAAVAAGYLCAISPAIPCLAPGHVGAEIKYYNADGTVIYEGAMAIGADGTVTTDELTGLRVPARGSAEVAMYWEQKTLVGATAYRFTQTKSWAWDHGEVTYYSHDAFPSRMDSFQEWQGISGHTSDEGVCSRPPQKYRECVSSWYQGQFCNSLPLWGCVSHTHPQVAIWVDGFGKAQGCAAQNALIGGGFRCDVLREP